MKSELLRLFKAVVVKSNVVGPKQKRHVSEELLKKTIKRGFIFSSNVLANYSESELGLLVAQVEQEVGLTSEKMNATFHKSWAKVKNASMEQLVMEQLVHYLTTYGFEALGIYNEDSVYIPKEKLEIPELKEGIKLVVIKGYTEQEIKDKVIKLLQSGIALKEDTVKDVFTVAIEVGFKEKDIELVRNKEIKIAFYDHFGIVPNDPLEFLRYVIFKTTKSTLLIKNKMMISLIKAYFTHNNINDGKDITKAFKTYVKDNSLGRLAEIFYRFKPLFLAFRSNKEMKKIVNKIRRLAVEHHKPMQESYLNTITSQLKNNIAIDVKLLQEELDKVNIFRKIRLMYALKFRTIETDSILYKVRNGKSFATKFEFTNQDNAKRILDIVTKSIVNDMKSKVEGKKVYIPKDVIYALPATEKQFTGNIPSGSCVKVDKDMVFGVHWYNSPETRVDIDLSLLNIDGKIGWNDRFRSSEDGDADILFSGDVTDAPRPNGATELFYVQRQVKGAHMMMVNNYTFNFGKYDEVSFDIIVGKEQVSNLNRNYMVDPNNIVATVKSSMQDKQKMLGIIVTTTKGNRFYFTESSLGNSIVSTNNEYTEQAREFTLNYYEHAPTLNDLLEKAGCILVDDKSKCDIDLSIESLEKDKIISLISKE